MYHFYISRYNLYCKTRILRAQTREYIDWRRQASYEHSVMMVFSAQLADGEGHSTQVSSPPSQRDQPDTRQLPVLSYIATLPFSLVELYHLSDCYYQYYPTTYTIYYIRHRKKGVMRNNRRSFDLLVVNGNGLSHQIRSEQKVLYYKQVLV